ncbi:MAG TPA: nuclear transport factor 2 family protein [Pseudolabrys sp.]|nr:nuclear transport factor 2 family protein [Pseudolabrys sp.]
MGDTVPRSVVEAFYRTLSKRDAAALASFLHDDVAWTISGPVDILPYCGQRKGKGEVMALLTREIPTHLQRLRFAAKTMLVDGDRAAILGRLTATKGEGGRSVSYRIAHFIQFCDNKVIDYVSIIDSFDAVEQMLGHSIDAHDGYRIEGDRVPV